MTNLADLHDDLGRRDLALPLFRDVLQRSRRILGNRHPSTLDTMAKMGQSLYRGGDTAASIELLEEAAAGSTTIRGVDHPGTRHALQWVAFVKRSHKRQEQDREQEQEHEGQEEEEEEEQEVETIADRIRKRRRRA
jgi:hypothetical protein